jgi:protein subunit release factor A
VTDHRINENFFGIDNMATGTMLVEIHEKLKDWEVQLALEKLIAEE